MLYCVYSASASKSIQSEEEVTLHTKVGSIGLSLGVQSSAGIAVNKCANMFGYSFKVQLVAGILSLVGCLGNELQADQSSAQ